MTLTELQRDFVASVAAGSLVGSCQQGVAARGEIDSSAGLAIYRSNWLAARVGALLQVYPLCRQIVGVSCLRALAGDFAVQDPSSVADLNLYGEGFGSFLAAELPTHAALRELDYLPDLARLEWLLHCAYYADVDRITDWAEWQRVLNGASGEAKFCLGNSVGLLRTAYPLLDIRDMNLHGCDSPVAMPDSEQLILVQRRERAISAIAVTPAVFSLLQRIAAGQSVGELLEGASVAVNEVMNVLFECTGNGWIVGLESGGNDI